MRVVYIDLHKNGTYLENLQCIVMKKRAIMKHRFLLDSLIDDNVEVCDYLTWDGVSLPHSIRGRLKSTTLRKWEARYVFYKNSIDATKITFLSDPSEIRDDDIIIYYATFHSESLENANFSNGIKIVEHYHFYGNSETAERIKNKNVKYYMFDVDLGKYSKLYQKNYAWFDGDYIMRPFAYQPRFCVKTEFSQRKTKAVAMGTLTKEEFPEFVETYGTPYYQPGRKMIMDNAASYGDELDSYISEFEEEPLLQIKSDDPKFIKMYKKAVNMLKSGRQKKYFSFDMVEKYNEYKMFICPEDIHGSYGVGTIEGMACGCAMIGKNYGAFEDMGMTAGIHYIAYDGTMENLIDKIRYYQLPENQEELEKIAKEGCAFVRERFSQERVARDYLNTLIKISKEYTD